MDNSQAVALHDGTSDGHEAATPTRILRSVWHHRLLVLVISALVAPAAYAASVLQPAVYRSESRIFLTNPADTVSGETAPSTDPEIHTLQQVPRVTAAPVLERASQQLNGRWSVDELESMVTVAPQAEALVLLVGANAPTPQASTDIVEAVTQAYGEFNQSTAAERAQPAIDEARQSQEELRAEIDEIQAELSSSPGDSSTRARIRALTEELLLIESTARTLSIEAKASGIDLVEQARILEDPIRPKPVRDAALAGVLGFVAAAAVTGVRSRRRRPLDPATVLGAPLLATIPDFNRGGGMAIEQLLDSEASEAYQFLVAPFEYAVARRQVRSVLVTSATPAAGKSVTALHLARALALRGRDVMLVDGDIRAGGLTSLLNADGRPGLVSLADGEHIDEVVRTYRIAHDVQLRVIPTGQTPSNPTGLLATDRYRNAIANITASNEMTVIDGAPLLAVADASALAGQVSGILLVLDADTSEDELLEVQHRLQLIPTPLIGFVVNRSPKARTVSAYPYTYTSPPRRSRRQGLRDTTGDDVADDDQPIDDEAPSPAPQEDGHRHEHVT